MNRSYSNGGEIKNKIAKLQAVLDDPRTTDAGERERLQKGIEKLKGMLPSEEKPAEKKEEPKERKKPVEKKEPKSEKADKSKKKGVQVLSSKRVKIDGREVDVDSQEFCDYLLAQFRERREKAQQKKSSKKKTKSVMSKVSQSIERGITTAIKSGIKDNKVAINKNPKVFIGKVEKLESATKNFLQNLKEVLGDEYDAKEITSTTNAIQELIDDLKKKYSK